MPTVTARFPDALDDDVEDCLEYGENKSDFIRDGARIMAALNAADPDEVAEVAALLPVDELEWLEIEDAGQAGGAEPALPDGGGHEDA